MAAKQFKSPEHQWRLVLAAAIFCCGVEGSFAETTPTGESQPSAAVTAPSTTAGPATLPDAKAEPASVAHVQGFRSAKFGMTEADVRAAIAKDFSLKSDAIKTTKNASEQTQILSARLPELLPGGGSADIAYVFGYKTKALIQVTLVWSKGTDPKITPDQLVANADMLRASFTDQGYRPETVVVNTPTKAGFIAFQGQDADAHTTVLMLQGTSAADKDQKIFTATSLILLYIADAKHPDIFKLTPGQF